MRLLQVTLLATATPITNAIPVAGTAYGASQFGSFQQITIQNNAAAVVRVGDSTVSATRGMALSAGSPGSSGTFTTSIDFATSLDEWYLFGTAGQVIDIMLL